MLRNITLLGPRYYLQCAVMTGNLYSRSGYSMIGAPHMPLTFDIIREHIRASGDLVTDPTDTIRFDIVAHGERIKHLDRDGFYHVMQFGDNLENTKEIVSFLGSLTNNIPVECHILSCFGGTAAEDIEVISSLPVGSSVFAHMKSDVVHYLSDSLYKAKLIEQDMMRSGARRNVFAVFAQQLLVQGNQGIIFSIKLKDESIKFFDFSPNIIDILRIQPELRNNYFRTYLQGLFADLRVIAASGNLPDNLIPPDDSEIPEFTIEEINEFLINLFHFKVETQPQDLAWLQEVKALGFNVNVSILGVPLICSAAYWASGIKEFTAETFKALVDVGIDINAQSRGVVIEGDKSSIRRADLIGFTPLMLILNNDKAPEDRKRILDIVHTMLAAGADPNITSHDGNTALFCAMSSLFPSVFIESILDEMKGLVDINYTGSDGETVLMKCIHKGNTTVNKIIEVYGSTLNLDAVKRKDGNTALMIAVLRRERDIVENLLLAGADKDIRNKNGKTAQDLINGSEEAKIAIREIFDNIEKRKKNMSTSGPILHHKKLSAGSALKKRLLKIAAISVLLTYCEKIVIFLSIVLKYIIQHIKHGFSKLKKKRPKITKPRLEEKDFSDDELPDVFALKGQKKPRVVIHGAQAVRRKSTPENAELRSAVASTRPVASRSK